MLSMRSSEPTGELPGLLSVESATGTPFARKLSSGGSFVSRRK